VGREAEAPDSIKVHSDFAETAMMVIRDECERPVTVSHDLNPRPIRAPKARVSGIWRQATYTVNTRCFVHNNQVTHMLEIGI